MEYCSECYAVEQGFEWIVNESEEYTVCECCGAEDSRVFVDEDYGKDR